jgi:type VI secretion system secreted protein VgrG
MATAAGASSVEQQLERFDYAPGAFLFESDKGEATPHADDRGRYRTDEAEAAAMARRRLDAERAEALSCVFSTNAVDLAPGVVFAMRDHPRRELAEDRSLLVVDATMHGKVGEMWSVRVEARSSDVPYRPQLTTPKPKVNGVESATIVGPAGQEIHTDEFGRVRVHFHWDRESQMNENSSCWIHVSQPWGGTGYGGVNVPRIGQEVLVDFLGGDPDRPVIVGRVYTNLQRVPYALPDNKTQSGWRSNSTNATGGYNELMFEDAAGKELVRMQAEKDMHKLVKHDEAAVVGHDRTRQVGHDETLAVANNRSKTVGVDETTEIGRNQSETVGLNRSVQVGVNHTEVIGATMNLTVGAAMNVAVGGTKTEVVGGASTETVGGAKALAVGGNYSIGVAGSMGTTVGGDQTESVGGAKLIQVGSVYELVCGASKIYVDSGGVVTIEATNISLKASGPIELQAGSTVKVQASGSVTVLGSTVSVN